MGWVIGKQILRKSKINVWRPVLRSENIVVNRQYEFSGSSFYGMCILL